MSPSWPIRATLELFILAFVVDLITANDVYVVGYNDWGQLGLGDYLERTTETLIDSQLPLDRAYGLAAGLYHSVALGDTGTTQGLVYTWGRNSKGQLGLGPIWTALSPQAVEWKACPEPNSWVCNPSLCKSVCDASKCTSYGSANFYWKPSDMQCMKPQDIVWGTAPQPQIVQIVASVDSTFVLTKDGKIFSWGANDWGQLGITDYQQEMLARPDGKYFRSVPMLINSIQNLHFLELAAGDFHVIALNDLGEVWSWGNNVEGQLGVGDLSQRSQPAQVVYMEGLNTVKVAAGSYHSLVLTDFGQVYSMGLNANGQLGLGDYASRKAPTLISYLATKNISSIACGDYASYAITDAGEVFAWGDNSFGQLGQSAAVTYNVPSIISTLQSDGAVVYRMFGGQRTIFAIDESGIVYAFGNNDYGMLGLGDKTTRKFPTKISSFVGANVYVIASGAYHTIAATGCWEQGNPCSGHGTCNSNGVCICDTGYRGSVCSDECPGGVGNACNLHGNCIIPGTGSSYCLCFSGYTGTACEIECPGGALNPCSSNGECLSTGVCECNSGFSGGNCSLRCPGAMSSPCSDLGLCVNGACLCYTGFTGLNCSTECEGGASNPCSYNGECQLDGSCKCYTGFRRPDCSCECPGGHDNICYGHGTCTQDCRCSCRVGYRGANCSTQCAGGLQAYLEGELVTVKVCSGHGECNEQGTCLCYAGWSGKVCDHGPYNWLPVILISSSSLLVCCCSICIGISIRRRQKKFSNRERKRQSRRKLRGKKKHKSGDRKKDRSRKKSKINK
uniref:EGF-like domain-containing protein n=1 Tax=Hanusia phi TaxID=3032 RepID=A0A7S0HXF5_9CRYP|mmetsp:Transcript_5641/g.13100  ORF Transcript_5641/g.13100 Transcript_5641/m.13100 type:complete len:788 (+) Transcript_5641:215-2578(+)